MQPWEQHDHTNVESRDQRNVLVAILAAVVACGATVVAIVVVGRASDSATGHAVFLAGAVVATSVAAWYGLERWPQVRVGVLAGMGLTMVAAIAVGGYLSRPTAVDENVVTATRTRSDAVNARPTVSPTPPMPSIKSKDTAPRAAEPARDTASARAPAPVEPASAPDAPKSPSVAAPAAKPAPAQPEPAPKHENLLLASGTFEALEHPGAGTASIIRTTDGTHVLTFTNFATDAVPDPFVWLVAGDPANDAAAESGRYISLGKLKGNSGNQQYTLPAGTDPDEFTHVYVWCRAFASGVTRARLA